MELDYLKNIGAVPASLGIVPMKGVTCVSAETILSEKESVVGDRVVVLDNATWIATSKRRPPIEANSVYSGGSAGDFVGCYKQKENVFLIMQLYNEQLRTIKKIKFKEVTSMDLNTDEMNAFELDVDAFEASSGEVPPEPVKQDSDKKEKKLSDEARWVANIKSQIPKDGILARDEAIRNNRKSGRLVCFITATDNVIKLTTKNKVQLDANGDRVVNRDCENFTKASAELRKKWEKTGKYPNSVCFTDKYLAFNDTPPPRPKGMIVKVPAGSDIDIDQLNSSGSFNVDKSRNDFVYKFLTMDMAYLYVPGNFGSNIREDEDIVGPRASTIGFAARLQKYTDRDTKAVQQKVVSSFYLDKDHGEVNRKKLICSTNFFPAKVYETVPFADIKSDPKILESVNINVASALNKAGTYDALDAESKELVQLHDDGTYTCAWFNDQQPIQVTKFDGVDASDVVTDVRIPLRVAVPNKKDPNKLGYKFKYINVGEPGGPQEHPIYKRIIEHTGMDAETFAAKVAKITARVARSKASADLVTGDVYLSAVANGFITDSVAGTFASLSENMERLNA